jgi:ATP-dependent Zn protease
MHPKPKIAIVAAATICVGLLWWIVASHRQSAPLLTYSQFLAQVQAGQVRGAIVFGNNSGAVSVTYRLKTGGIVRTVLPSDYRYALKTMQANAVNIEIREFASTPLRIFLNATPFLVLLALWILVMTRGFPRGPLPRLFGS